MSTLVEPCLLRLQNKHPKMISARSKRNPRIEPITIPAMAPPLSPCPWMLLFEPVPLFGEEVALAVAVEVKTLAIEEKTGSVTS